MFEEVSRAPQLTTFNSDGIWCVALHFIFHPFARGFFCQVVFEKYRAVNSPGFWLSARPSGDLRSWTSSNTTERALNRYRHPLARQCIRHASFWQFGSQLTLVPPSHLLDISHAANGLSADRSARTCISRGHPLCNHYQVPGVRSPISFADPKSVH